MSIGNYIKELRTERGMSQEELGKIVGVQRAAVQKWENGSTQNLKRETIKKLAEFFGVSPASFIEEYSNIIFFDDIKMFNAPLYESVSAGCGVSANEDAIGYAPVEVNSQAEAKETFCVKVKGDSMSPDIQDGDIIQVHRQTSVDTYDIAVICVDDYDYLVKRVVYGDDYIKLISLNMTYKPLLFEGADVLRCRVLGKVIGLSRKF